MDSGEFTVLLEAWAGGSRDALDQLTPAVYTELRHIAASLLGRERAGHTLQPTALIHEAYLRLTGHKQHEWSGRKHFFAVASHLMRQILSNHARARNAGKRGSGDRPVTFDEAVSGGVECGASFVAMDDALNELAKFDERKSRLIEMKYFGGLTGEEIAEVLDTSRSTVVRETRIAEAWLQDYLNRR